MDVEQHGSPEMRASDMERDEAMVRLHTAYAEGRLDEAELEQRMDWVLAARTRRQLDVLLSDLPEARRADATAAALPAATAPVGRLQVAYKNGLCRRGRWRVPRRGTVVIYKGDGELDLRKAELEDPLTRIRVLAYKSDVDVIVPAGVRVEIGGLGVSSDVHGAVPADAPLLRISGYAYKGVIEARSG